MNCSNEEVWSTGVGLGCNRKKPFFFKRATPSEELSDLTDMRTFREKWLCHLIQLITKTFLSCSLPIYLILGPLVDFWLKKGMKVILQLNLFLLCPSKYIDIICKQISSSKSSGIRNTVSCKTAGLTLCSV